MLHHQKSTVFQTVAFLLLCQSFWTCPPASQSTLWRHPMGLHASGMCIFRRASVHFFIFACGCQFCFLKKNSPKRCLSNGFCAKTLADDTLPALLQPSCQQHVNFVDGLANYLFLLAAIRNYKNESTHEVLRNAGKKC